MVPCKKGEELQLLSKPCLFLYELSIGIYFTVILHEQKAAQSLKLEFSRNYLHLVEVVELNTALS